MSSKLSKSELKKIVKECLVEILKEGIMSTSNAEMLSETQSRPRRRTSFDHVSWAKEKKADRDQPNYDEHARSLTDNPILAEVLADSQKTMVDQLQAEKLSPSALSGDFAERAVANSDPSDLFADAAGNWAALAFGTD